MRSLNEVGKRVHGKNFMPYFILFRSRDSAVGVVTGYGLDCLEVVVQVPVRARFFLLSTSSRPVSGAHTASYVIGSGGCFPRDKAARV
jgi:hypothetical protein